MTSPRGRSKKLTQLRKGITNLRHRFPPEFISHAVWLYRRFTLSIRELARIMNRFSSRSDESDDLTAFRDARAYPLAGRRCSTPDVFFTALR